MKARSTPVTRYDFISQLAEAGLLTPARARPEPRPPAELRAIFAQGDQTHLDPRDARAGRRHMLAYWDKWRY